MVALMITRRHFAMAALALSAAACGEAPVEPKMPRSAGPEADLILTGGVIYTMSPEQPRAEALAVSKGRIIAVGSAEEVRRVLGSSTRVIHLEGAP
jgi:hypothetical protein